ncbi:uncharacterized protein LOC134096289 isoform X2 [Sardina pilchardus]|uniref:uncharacterized protein LOC134096289 isoform X2 n=1 Tax=Sardina pilchardus TaxID=27697 RepID=UPI002E15B57C
MYQEVKKKWESLRTQFGRYRKPSPSGSSRTKRTARQRWILRKLQFLQPHTKTKESASDLTHTEPLASSDASSGDDAAADASVMDNNTDRTPRDPAGFESFSSGTSAESTRRPRAKRRRKSPNDPLTTTTADLIRSMEAVLERMSAEARRDFIAVTCQSIEHKFRMVPPHLLPRLENRVQNLIFNFFEEHNLGNHPDTHANGC